jgi:hypothetical protein
MLIIKLSFFICRMAFAWKQMDTFFKKLIIKIIVFDLFKKNNKRFLKLCASFTNINKGFANK